MTGDEGMMAKLRSYGDRIRKAFEPEPEPKPVSDSTQKAIDKAVGPRFQKKVEPIKPILPRANPIVKTGPLHPYSAAEKLVAKPIGKRTKRGPSKY